jgi:hypothetical protein
MAVFRLQCSSSSSIIHPDEWYFLCRWSDKEIRQGVLPRQRHRSQFQPIDQILNVPNRCAINQHAEPSNHCIARPGV